MVLSNLNEIICFFVLKRAGANLSAAVVFAFDSSVSLTISLDAGVARILVSYRPLAGRDRAPLRSLGPRQCVPVAYTSAVIDGQCAIAHRCSSSGTHSYLGPSSPNDERHGHEPVADAAA